MVAGWLVGERVVERRIASLFPVAEQRRRMVDYTTVRVVEKIIGVGIESKTGHWNWRGLWDPRADTSFMGWARQLAVAIAKGNARRVLACDVIPASLLEADDGFNAAWDDRRSESVTSSRLANVFDTHPGLTVFRPFPPQRILLWDRLEHAALRCADGMRRRDALERVADSVVDECRHAGAWHDSMDVLDPVDAVDLMLMPLPASAGPRLPFMFPGHERAAELYWPTQTRRPRLADMAELRRQIRLWAEGEPVGADGRPVRRFDIWCRLSTATAMLGVG